MSCSTRAQDSLRDVKRLKISMSKGRENSALPAEPGMLGFERRLSPLPISALRAPVPRAPGVPRDGCASRRRETDDCMPARRCRSLCDCASGVVVKMPSLAARVAPPASVARLLAA